MPKGKMKSCNKKSGIIGSSENNPMHELLRELKAYLIICACVYIAFTTVLSMNFVPSESMEPTIHRNHLIVNLRLNYLLGDPVPQRGSVIVFRENSDQKRLLVKRVIGLPGDLISFSGGHVYCNGEKLHEPYVLKQESSFSAVTEYQVPEESIFVLGDNRENSRDSRFMEGTYVLVENIYARELFQVPLFIAH